MLRLHLVALAGAGEVDPDTDSLADSPAVVAETSATAHFQIPQYQGWNLPNFGPTEKHYDRAIEAAFCTSSASHFANHLVKHFATISNHWGIT